MRHRPVSFTMSAVAILSLGTAAVAEPAVTITNLQTLAAPYNDASTGGRINNYGQVTFQSFGKGQFLFGHAGLWTPEKPNGTTGTLTDIDPNPEQRPMQSGGAGINASGQVVGFTSPPPSPTQSLNISGLVWSPATPNSGGSGHLSVITPSESPGEIHIFAINNPSGDHGAQAVGNSPLHMDGILCHRALLWDDGKPTELGTLSSDNSGDANDINDATEVVGYTFLQTRTVAGPRHAYLWKAGKMVPLGTLFGDTESVATAINASGQVAGNSFGAKEGSRSFIWTPTEPNGVDGVMADIGVLKDYTDMTAFGINAQGQVVGRAYIGSRDLFPAGHAFIYDSINGMRDLNSLLPANSGWELQVATGINDRGQIVGTGVYTEKDKKKKVSMHRAFLMTISQDPASASDSASTSGR